MFNRFTHHLPHYFHQPLTRTLEALYTAVGLQDFALAMMMLFEPVFLYQLGYSVSQIAGFYALVYVFYIILVPLGGKFVARYSPPRAIAVSTIFLVLYYVTLLGIESFPVLFWFVPILFAMQKTLYWPGYHADFIAASKDGERGREFAMLYSLTTVMYIVGPAIGGVLITWFGFPALFLIGALIIFFSSLPLLFVPVNHTRTSFSYRTSMTLPFQAAHRRTTVAYLGFGEQLLLNYIWPIYLAITFKTLERLGGLAALATLVTALVTLYLGKLFDRGHWHRVLRGGALISAVNWFIRLFITSTGQVFGSAVIGQIGQNLTWVTSSDVAYERAIKENNPIGRSILLEQGLSYGKILAALLVFIFGQMFDPFVVAFIVGSAFSLLYLRFR